MDWSESLLYQKGFERGALCLLAVLYRTVQVLTVRSNWIGLPLNVPSTPFYRADLLLTVKSYRTVILLTVQSDRTVIDLAVLLLTVHPLPFGRAVWQLTVR